MRIEKIKERIKRHERLKKENINNDIIKGIKLSIEIAKKEIDQDQIEKFCNHIGVTQVYFKSETIDKIVKALENEIKKKD